MSEAVANNVAIIYETGDLSSGSLQLSVANLHGTFAFG